MAAIRQRHLLGKVKAKPNITDRDMLANPLTKSIVKQRAFDQVLDASNLELQDNVQYRCPRDIEMMGDTDLDSLWAASSDHSWDLSTGRHHLSHLD